MLVFKVFAGLVVGEANSTPGVFIYCRTNAHQRLNIFVIETEWERITFRSLRLTGVNPSNKVMGFDLLSAKSIRALRDNLYKFGRNCFP